MLFLSVSIAIRFSSRFFRSINNLISAAKNIGKGNLDVKVPEIKTDKELEVLNKNFNSSLNYKVQDQYSDTLAREKKVIEDLINETYSNLLITLSENINQI